MDADNLDTAIFHSSTRTWLAVASLAGALILGTGWRPGAAPRRETTKAQATREVDTRADTTVAIGDSTLTTPVAPFQAPFAWSTIAVDMPPRPLPGQARPDANGRCRTRGQVAINGGCWKKLAVELKDCDEVDYVYKGSCYVPAFPPPRPGMSNPMGIASTLHARTVQPRALACGRRGRSERHLAPCTP